MVIAHHQDCLCAKQTKFSLLGKETGWGKEKEKCVVIKHQHVLPRRLSQAMSDLKAGSSWYEDSFTNGNSFVMEISFEKENLTLYFHIAMSRQGAACSGS